MLVFVDPEGKLVVLHMTYRGKSFKLVSVYAPQRGVIQNGFFEHFSTWETLIVLGDFNAILNA